MTVENKQTKEFQIIICVILALVLSIWVGLKLNNYLEKKADMKRYKNEYVQPSDMSDESFYKKIKHQEETK